MNAAGKYPTGLKARYTGKIKGAIIVSEMTAEQAHVFVQSAMVFVHSLLE